MTIIIGENYGVTLPGGNILGSMGENRLRTHKVVHPKFEDASYILRLRYSDGKLYDTEVKDGVLTVYGSLLRSPGEIEAQFRAVKTDSSGDKDEKLVFQSEIFKLRIDPAIDGSASEIPPYEESKSLFEELLEGMKKRDLPSTDRVVLTGSVYCGFAADAESDLPPIISG